MVEIKKCCKLVVKQSMNYKMKKNLLIVSDTSFNNFGEVKKVIIPNKKDIESIFLLFTFKNQRLLNFLRREFYDETKIVQKNIFDNNGFNQIEIHEIYGFVINNQTKEEVQKQLDYDIVQNNIQENVKTTSLKFFIKSEIERSYFLPLYDKRTKKVSVAKEISNMNLENPFDNTKKIKEWKTKMLQKKKTKRKSKKNTKPKLKKEEQKIIEAEQDEFKVEAYE